MNDEEIAAIAGKLDEATQSAHCVVKIVQHGGGADESYMTATQGGYLKLAALCLRAASSPLKSESKMVDLENDDVIHEDSDTQISWLERDETLHTPEYVAPQLSTREKMTGALFGIGCFVFALIIIASIGVGLFVIAENAATFWWR